MTEGADEYDAMISPPKRLTYRWLTPALRNGDILLTAGLVLLFAALGDERK